MKFLLGFFFGTVLCVICCTSIQPARQLAIEQEIERQKAPIEAELERMENLLYAMQKGIAFGAFDAPYNGPVPFDELSLDELDLFLRLQDLEGLEAAWRLHTHTHWLAEPAESFRSLHPSEWQDEIASRITRLEREVLGSHYFDLPVDDRLAALSAELRRKMMMPEVKAGD